MVEGGISSKDTLGILRRFLALRISPCLIFHDAAASRRPDSDNTHHCNGCTSSALCVPRRVFTRSPMHQALPLGGGGRTRSKHVSPVQVSVLPSLGFCKDFASEGLPLQASSTTFISGHCVPANNGFVVRSTSMCWTSIRGGSLGVCLVARREWFAVQGVRERGNHHRCPKNLGQRLWRWTHLSHCLRPYYQRPPRSADRGLRRN